MFVCFRSRTIDIHFMALQLGPSTNCDSLGWTRVKPRLLLSLASGASDPSDCGSSLQISRRPELGKARRRSSDRSTQGLGGPRAELISCRSREQIIWWCSKQAKTSSQAGLWGNNISIWSEIISHSLTEEKNNATNQKHNPQFKLKIKSY